MCSEPFEQCDWRLPHGADADHLKSEADVDRTAAAGFTFFTIDPSDYVEQQADDFDVTRTLDDHFASIQDRVNWLDDYLAERSSSIVAARSPLTPTSLKRAAVKYGNWQFSLQFELRPMSKECSGLPAASLRSS